MNEKIKELALDAGIGFTLWDDSGREMIDNYTPEERLTKFAELIVRECIGVVEGGSFLHDQAPTAIFARECSGAIKRHFGVE